jgi:hypothetical protein
VTADEIQRAAAALARGRKILAAAQATFRRAAEMGANRVNLGDVQALLSELDRALATEE